MKGSPLDWYRLSAKHQAAFFEELGKLTNADVEQIVRSVADMPSQGPLRPLAEIRSLRAELPTLEELSRREPNELTLQLAFMHRGHLSTTSEKVVAREIPISPAGMEKEGWCDLLVFDQETSVPILVELKRAEADDSLSGVLFEVLFHWAFHKRHFAEFREQLDADGIRVPTTVTQPMATIAAPRSYFVETRRRSQDKRRDGEYERALGMIEYLRERLNLRVKLLAIDDGWKKAMPAFDVVPYLQ